MTPGGLSPRPVPGPAPASGLAHGRRLRIGISACFFHADPTRDTFRGKTLQYVEQSIAHWTMSTGALAVMVPSPDGLTRVGDAGVADYAAWLDALVLEGGSDVWPGSYGEEPRSPAWAGDRIRDAYEIALLRAFEAEGKPVLGVCRGLQLMNVAFGGTLWQDLPSERPGPVRHRDPERYDHHLHDLAFEPGSALAALFAGVAAPRVNSIHHQAVRRLASGFVVEAWSPLDGGIEAIRRPGGSYMAAVQWHPEFHRAVAGTLDDRPLLDEFLGAAATRAATGRSAGAD